MTEAMTRFPPVGRDTEDRLNEVARILALGVLRLRARQDIGDGEKTAGSADFGVDFGGGQSVCGSEPENNGERT